MIDRLTRRQTIKLGAAGLALAASSRIGHAATPITIGIPAAQSGPAGIADHQDWRNGVSLAIEEINAAGGVNGRPLEALVVDIDILTPEGTLAAFQKLTEAKVSAIASPFVLIPQPAMDAAAAAGVPYLHGNTSIASLDLFKSDPKKYRNIFQLDVAETWYGTGLIRFVTDLKAKGGWTPKNNKVHIVQEQIAYTQVISKATQAAVAATNGAWEIGAITDIQFPVQDWTPVISALKETDAGVIMIDHWVAAELASFAQAYVNDPVPGALVYLQYGPSQPEFLDLAGDAAEGFVWGTVYGAYADKQGMAFRQAYQAKFPGTMGYVYTGGGYDTVKILAQVWASVDPADYDATGNALRAIRYRGVNGAYSFDNDRQSGTSYPNMVSDPEKGQAHLIMQVQDGAHKIIAPEPYVETDFRNAPWM
jgi:branched-chain amino acid transport system substrate-binding protein